MKVKSTKQYAKMNGIKFLVYGRAGVGKTSLIPTLQDPIIISTEAGLLSIADHDLPVLEVNTTEDLAEALEFVTSKKGKKYKSVCLDSISDIAEVCLADLKKESRDPRRAYGDLADRMMTIIRAFRDLKGRNVYFTAKMDVAEDGSHFPSMPGKQLTRNLPHLFDEVFALRIWDDPESGEQFRYLQCQPDDDYTAKDRSGKLSEREKPDLGKIIKKINKKSWKQ